MHEPERAAGRGGPPERVLRLMAEGTAACVGDEFFRALVSRLAAALDVTETFAAEFCQDRTRVRTLACWRRERFVDAFEYGLAGTPCEAVLCGETRHYPDRVGALFPEDRALVESGIKGYLAMPLVTPGGDVLGHLAALHDDVLDVTDADLAVFEIFAARAAVELQRRQVERALAESEERLAGILDSAMDAVIAIDADRRIRLFNRAAERVFGCAADQALGQTLDRFVSRRFRALLEGGLAGLDAGEPDDGAVWAPSGLTALRADGREFPVELTISPTRIHGEPFATVILRDIGERAHMEARLRELSQENLDLREQVIAAQAPGELIGDSAPMRSVREVVASVAPSDTTVLLLGETGTGKELIARALHEASPRRDRLLVRVNCAALPAELIESELFGHEKGAFTGATAQRKGRFELADGGTLFLDEVGELSPAAQAKLLRALQEREIERVGAAAPIRVDVRVIAATNRDLEAMVAEGTFRADLYYRLNVFPIRVPSLRERREDIAPLALHFLARLARRLGKRIDGIAPGCVARLEACAWPGNIRELQNVLERAAILAGGPVIDRADLPDPILSAHAGGGNGASALADVERHHIERVLAETGGVIEGPAGAAVRLGLKASTLRFRLKKLGIPRAPG